MTSLRHGERSFRGMRARGADPTPAIAAVATVLVLVVSAAGIMGLSPAVALVPALTVVLLLAVYPEMAVCSVLVALTFGSTCVALAMPTGVDDGVFNLARAIPFIMTAVLALAAGALLIARPGMIKPGDRRLLLFVFAALGAAGVYFAVGIAKNSPAAASTYLRNISGGYLLFLGSYVFMRSPSRLNSAFSFLLIALIGWAAVELFARRELYEFLRLAEYLNNKATREAVFYADVDFIISRKSINLFNQKWIGGDAFRFARLQGPNVHTISFAYAIAVASSFMAARRQWGLAALGAIACAAVGSKGALFLLLLSGLAAALAAKSRLPSKAILLLIVSVTFAFVLASFTLGYLRSDYHVIGAIGGVKGFLQNPIGHGLGAGGNLGGAGDASVSAAGMWRRFQAIGGAYGLESAWGVLLYQMGIATVAIGAPMVMLVRRFVVLADQVERRLRSEYLVPCAMLTGVMGTGVLQEEALFAPLALGLVLVICGELLSRPVLNSQRGLHA